MRKINTSELTPGMVLSTDVYNYNDQLILPEGLVLTDKAIMKLAFYSILFVYIQDQGSTPYPPKASVTESSYSQRLMGSPEFKQYRRDFEDTVSIMHNTLNDIVRRNEPFDTHSLVQQALQIIHPENSEINFFDMIHNMRNYDDLTYAHSLNVGLICNVFAEWLGLSKEECQHALLCGLLHDIGKLKIPDTIIKKPAKLTDSEYQVIKTHPVEGYKILQACHCDLHVCNAALMHHERCDGSGYPLGIDGSRIDFYAKIVAIADVYEAMTALRIYRGPLCPFQVISAFETEGLQKYDAKMIMTFLENIVNTYMLNRVRLSNGMEGDIIFINKQALSRPTIKCGSEYIDLSKRPELSIVSIV